MMEGEPPENGVYVRRASSRGHLPHRTVGRRRVVRPPRPPSLAPPPPSLFFFYLFFSSNFLNLKSDYVMFSHRVTLNTVSH